MERDLKIEKVENGYIITHYKTLPDKRSVFKTGDEMIKFVNEYFEVEEGQNEDTELPFLWGEST